MVSIPTLIAATVIAFVLGAIAGSWHALRSIPKPEEPDE